MSELVYAEMDLTNTPPTIVQEFQSGPANVYYRVKVIKSSSNPLSYYVVASYMDAGSYVIKIW